MKKNQTDQNSQQVGSKSSLSPAEKKKELRENEPGNNEPDNNDPTRTDKPPLIISKL